MIADDGQVPVRVAVADLIDPDPVEGLQPAGVEQLGHPAVDDRGDGFPGAAHQGGHRGAVGALGQPQHHVLEVTGMPGAGACPGQFLGAYPAVGAVQPADLIDQPQPAAGQVQMSPAAPPPVIDRAGQHCRTGSAQSGPRAQGDLDIAVSDDDIGHHAPGICSRRLNAVLTRTRCLRVAVGVVTPKPRATPRARPSFHPRNADSPAAQPKPALTSTKAPTKTRGAPHKFEPPTSPALM